MFMSVLHRSLRGSSYSFLQALCLKMATTGGFLCECPMVAKFEFGEFVHMDLAVLHN